MNKIHNENRKIALGLHPETKNPKEQNEKSIKTKNNNEIVKEYISIYNYNDKYTKLIRPTGEQKFTNKLGDSFFIEDKKRFPKAYQVFIDLRNFLNKK